MKKQSKENDTSFPSRAQKGKFKMRQNSNEKKRNFVRNNNN